MFANERNTCYIIIYRIICLFIILFFQKDNVDSGPPRFSTIYGLHWILQLDLDRSAFFEKWALSCEADIFMIVYKCWKPPEPVIIIIHRILCGGLRHGQWASSLVEGEKMRGLQYGKKNKQKQIKQQNTHSLGIRRHIKDKDFTALLILD